MMKSSETQLSNIIKIKKASELALEYNREEGEDSKKWIIDQMLRILLGNRYDAEIEEFNSDEDYPPWDTGIKPI